jgi:hypothetical protein
LPKVQLVGFIREGDVFNGPDLPGALAVLDDGRQQTVGASAMFDFNNVTPRWACVTASLAGYDTVKRCVQLMQNTINYDSIALNKSGGVDANEGPPDARPDAMIVFDGAPGGDGGNPLGGDGGGGGATGCCSASGSTCGASEPALALGLALVIRWRRRRRTRRR